MELISDKHNLKTEVGRCSFGEEVAQRRMRLGLSAEELASVAGVHKSTVNRVESGSDGLGDNSRRKVFIAIQKVERERSSADRTTPFDISPKLFGRLIELFPEQLELLEEVLEESGPITIRSIR